MNLRLDKYTDAYMEKWDRFVLYDSINGTFLQTRQFLSYHGNRFQDDSLIIFKGENAIVAVVPACIMEENGEKIFNSHSGSTFGGVILSKQFYDIEHLDEVMNVLEEYFHNEYAEVRMKCTSCIFSQNETNLLYYFLFNRGYVSYDELSCYIDLEDYNKDIITNFSHSRRRGYNKSLKYNLKLCKLEMDEEIEKFHMILTENLLKYNEKPIHTIEELLEFKKKRLVDIVEFYGVYWEKELIAGTMVFNFFNRVFHTQYLSSSQAHLEMFPMNFMNTKLIELAQNRGFKYFSFGISTEERGKVLNKSLAQFKEGFGTEYGINKTFIKRYY